MKKILFVIILVLLLAVSLARAAFAQGGGVAIYDVVSHEGFLRIDASWILSNPDEIDGVGKYYTTVEFEGEDVQPKDFSVTNIGSGM